MMTKMVLYHILVIWGLAQVTVQVTMNRGNLGGSSMMANGWRPLTGYESKNSGLHTIGGNIGGSSNERNSGPHPVHGKLHEHMASSEKLSATQTQQSHEYNPPSILGSFSVFGHSTMSKVRGNGEMVKTREKHMGPATSETREFSFLVPPPQEQPVRYEIDPYRKVILRDSDTFLRQPQQYILSHPLPPTELRPSQFFQKTGGVAVAASTHTLSTSKTRPVSPDVNGPANGNGIHLPFESLKLSNAKLYLQPPSASAALNFASEQQGSDNIYERYPSSIPSHNSQLTHEGPGNFYSQINHPAPSYKSHAFERDPSFLVHESHEVSYATPSSAGVSPFGNFRASSPYESLHPPKRYSTIRPPHIQSDKFVPSKTDNTHQQTRHNSPYVHYTQNLNGNLENTIITSDPNYSNGIANTYYISEQQSLTPPAPTWSIGGQSKVTPDINEVLPKTSVTTKFKSDPPNLDQLRQTGHQQVMNYLFPRPEVQQQQHQQHQQQQHQQQQQQQQHQQQKEEREQNQVQVQEQQQQHQQFQQQHYSNSPLALINQQVPKIVYETPESISLKHFNEQQYRLQQQLIQRDRERLREQELQRQQQQIDLGRITAIRQPEIEVTVPSSPTVETPGPTVSYIQPVTTVTYGIGNNEDQRQEIYRTPYQQTLHQDFQVNPSEVVHSDGDLNTTPEAGNGSDIVDVSTQATFEPEKSVGSHEFAEIPTTGHRNRSRKPTTSSGSEQQHRRRKPATTVYEEQRYNSQGQESSTLAPNPIIQSPGTSISPTSTIESSTAGFQIISLSTDTSVPTTTTTTTTARPRTRRPTVSGASSSTRRRRPSTTTTQEPETTQPLNYEQQEYVKYEKVENDVSRRRRIKPSAAQNYYEEPITSTEKKRLEIQNYGIKVGQNEQQVPGDFVSETTTEPHYGFVEQVSHHNHQPYSYTNQEEDKATLLYTPSYDAQLTNGQESSTEYESSGYPTSATIFSTQGNPTEYQQIDNSDVGKNVYTNIPLEELFVNTERIQATIPTSSTTPRTTTTTTRTTTTTTTTTKRPTTASSARLSATTSTDVSTTNSENVPGTRTQSHRIRPMRYGNTTRPRFSVKDYKSRLDYRNRMSSHTTSTTENPVPTNLVSRQKTGILKNQQDPESQPQESTTTGRYRHMSRVSYRVTSTTPSYQGRRTESRLGNSTAERVNKFTPKRRLHSNHLYKSKLTTTTDPSRDDGELTTAKHNSVRHENVFSSSIRRRPQMKHSVYTQSSDIKLNRKESTEMVPEETSFYSPALSQLLVESGKEPLISKNDDKTQHSAEEVKNNEGNDKDKNVEAKIGDSTDSSKMEIFSIDAGSSGSQSFDSSSENSNTSELSDATTSRNDETGQTEALVKSDNHVTINSQLEEDLFAKASQSVADLTSSASALYDKPGMFKAVSVSPSAADGTALLTSRFKIAQEKPTLPIEAFFQQLSNKN